MRIDGPQITGSFSLNGEGVQDLDVFATTSSLNTFTSSVNTTMGHVMTATHSLNTFTSSADSRMISIEGKTGSYATTGSNTFIGTQTVQGSIVPSSHATYDLGSPGNNFRHLYLSSASLYIDGTKVLGSTTQELQITTDNGQSFKILEAGSDTITLQSNDGNITLATSGGGDVILDPTSGIIALKGTTTIYAGNRVLSSDGNAIQFGNSVTMTGSLIVTGYIETQELKTTYISSSILYRSGSTKFGDELTDTHAFTGSLLVSGSISVPGSGLISGSSQVDVMSTTNIARLATTGSNTFSGIQTFNITTSENVIFNSPTNGGFITLKENDTITGYLQWGLTLSGNTGGNYMLITSAENGGNIALQTRTTGGTYNYSALVINSSGNVGIGGNSPRTRLQVTPQSNGEVPVLGTATGVATFTSANTNYGLQFNSTSDGTFHIQSQRFDNISTAYNLVLNYAGGNVGIGVSPSFPLDMLTSSSGTFNTIAQFQNTDFTTNNRSFIRVRQWINAGGSSSSYFGTGQDGNLYIIANDSARGGDLIINAGNGNVGVNTPTPLEKLSVTGNLHVAGVGNNLYFDTDGSGRAISQYVSNLYDFNILNSRGTSSRFILGNGSISLGTSGTAMFHINTTTGNVGINVSNGGSRFAVSGSNSGSNPLVDLTASGTGTFQRGVRLLNSGMNSGDHIMYAVGRSDNARNMGQTYFYYSGDGSTSNRLSFGLHSVDDVMHVQGNGSVSIGETTSFSSSKLAVNGPVKAGRKIFGWYQVTMPDGVAYFHMKTNMSAGGGGNIHYTMSLFYAEFYSYSAFIRSGYLGFHNWSGAFYNVVTTGNVWSSPYTSSDGYVVLVIALGNGSYNGLNIDWNQTYGYPYQDKTVTASSGSNNATGVY